MKAPSLRQIQQLYPLGNIEFDKEARAELNVVVQFRHLMVQPLSEFQKQETTDELNQMIEEDNAEREIASITQDDHDRRVMKMVSAIMAREDSQQPGLDVMLADNNFQAQEMVTKTISERAGGLMQIGMVIGGGSPQVPFSQIQCSVHGIIHWLFRCIIGRYLYRMHPELRFPVHRLIEYNVDVPDSSGTPQAIITGYNTKLILSLQMEERFIAPDTTEGLFDDDDDTSSP